jgi:hypothetical protein
MRLSISIAVVIVSVIVLLWFASHYYAKGRFPASFSDTKDFVKDSISRAHSLSTRADPSATYAKMSGYESGKPTALAISTLEKKETANASLERRLKISDKRKNEVATNSFLLAELYRFNDAASDADLQRARDCYARTLSRIAADPYQILLENDIRLNTPSVETMLNRIDDYIAPPQMPAIRDRVRSAKSKQKGPDYFSPDPIRSDPQNVHETQVSSDLARVFERVKSANDSLVALPSMLAIREAVESHRFESSSHKSRALASLSAIESGGLVSKLSATEPEIAKHVWVRINSPENASARDELVDAFMDSLTDATEKSTYSAGYHTVCTTGRAARLLGCLTLLDADSQIAAPAKTKELVRNEAFAKCRKIVESQLKKSPKEVADAYEKGDAPADSELESQVSSLESAIRKKIESHIEKHYSSTLSDSQLRELILDAQAGV